MPPQKEPEAAAATEAEVEEGRNLQKEPVFVRPLRLEDFPPLFVAIPLETVEKAHECIAKYNITGQHAVSDVAHKIHLETLRERQPPLNANTTLYIAQVCWP